MALGPTFTTMSSRAFGKSLAYDQIDPGAFLTIPKMAKEPKKPKKKISGWRTEKVRVPVGDIPHNSKVDTLPADLKAIAEESIRERLGLFRVQHQQVRVEDADDEVLKDPSFVQDYEPEEVVPWDNRNNIVRGGKQMQHTAVLKCMSNLKKYETTVLIDESEGSYAYAEAYRGFLDSVGRQRSRLAREWYVPESAIKVDYRTTPRYY